jgi:hypothetical protein
MVAAPLMECVRGSAVRGTLSPFTTAASIRESTGGGKNTTPDKEIFLPGGFFEKGIREEF